MKDPLEDLKSNDQELNTGAAKMIRPPDYYQPEDMSLAIKAIEFALAVMHKYSGMYPYKTQPYPPDPCFPMAKETQVDVGEDTERTV